MDCYRVKVHEGTRLYRRTASGQRVPIAPGEYHAHRFSNPRLKSRLGDTLRLVGADGRGRDVHVPLPLPSALRDTPGVEIVNWS